MKVVAVIQARMGSNRLPGKVLFPLPTGRSVLAEVIVRVQTIKGLDEVIVAIPDTAIDSVLIPHVLASGAKLHIGPHINVLKRYWEAAKEAKADVIMRITADCPLLDASVCETMLNNFRNGPEDWDYYSNMLPSTFPAGWACEIFTWELLDFTHANATSAEDREHVTRFMHSSWNRPHVNIGNFVNFEDWSETNYELNELKDYYRICAAMQRAMDKKQKAPA